MGKQTRNLKKKAKLEKENFKKKYYKMSQDQQLQRMIAQTQAQQQIQAIIHDLTEKCWDTCIDRPGPKMDGKSENCLKNCVQRFLDTNIAVTQNLEAKATNILNNHDNL